MQPDLQPVVLLADSSLLFKQWDGNTLPQLLCGQLNAPVRAGYIGASNGDDAQFFKLSVTAFHPAGVTDICHISCADNKPDLKALAACNLVLLSGGDVLNGFEIMQRCGMVAVLKKLYRQGAMLIGISAGAIQLGKGFLQNGRLVPMLDVVPYWIAVHDEADNWANLQKCLQRPNSAGIAIHFGGAVLFDGQQLKVLGKPALWFRRTDTGLSKIRLEIIQTEFRCKK